MRELSAEPTEGEKYKSQEWALSSNIKKVALPPPHPSTYGCHLLPKEKAIRLYLVGNDAQIVPLNKNLACNLEYPSTV